MDPKPKVFCICGAEMLVGEDEKGEAVYQFPVAAVEILGMRRLEQFGLWYVCSDPNCKRSFIGLEVEP